MNWRLFRKTMAVCGVSIVALVAVADVVLSVFGTEDKPTGANYPSLTVRESKARGAFVAPVDFTPSVIDWNGKRIAVGEAWLERRTELVQTRVFVPFFWEYRQYRKLRGYNLCFNLAEGWDVLWSDRVVFVTDGNHHSFGMMGTAVLWERLDEHEGTPAKIWVTDNWKLEKAQVISIKRLPR